MKTGVNRKRYRNNPPMWVVVRDYLAEHHVASFDSIYNHVIAQGIKLTSKTPRKSVYSTLSRMDSVERVGRASYRLRTTSET